MGLALGALGVLSLNTNNAVPFYYQSIFGHPNFKSLVLLVVLTVLICVVAYLTNPTEASFRTFLTELSFRHHLTRLNAQSNIPPTDVGCDGNDGMPDNGIVELGNQSRPLGIGLGISSRKSNSTSTRARSASNPNTTALSVADQQYPPSAGATGNNNITSSERRFQFSSKASVSLRTPTHVYRSFGLLTIAVVSPLTPVPPVTGSGLLGSVGSSTASHPDVLSLNSFQTISSSGSTSSTTTTGKETTGSQQSATSYPQPIAGTWYIGIFGTWFTGGRVVQRRSSSHAHSTTSGSLSAGTATSNGSAASSGVSGKKTRSRASRFTANFSETVANLAMGSSGASAGGTTTLSLRSRKGEEVGVIVPSRGTRFGLIKFEGDDEESSEGLNRNSLTPPKMLRNRSTSRSNIHQQAHSHGKGSQGSKIDSGFSQRSSSPPPLPKSASLPLHTKREKGASATSSPIPVVAVNSIESPHEGCPTGVSEATQQQQYLQQPQVHRPLSRVSSNSSLFESSPLISDLMAQLSASQSGVADLRTQLTSFESSASSAKSVLESEVQTQRTKKKSEDHMRAELRSRIKALEEEKRSAEGVRREREKSLAHALSRKREVERSLEKLVGEINGFKSTIEENEAKIEAEENELDSSAKEYEEKVENVKKEIEVVEKVLNQLNERVKDAEGRIGEEKARIASFQMKKIRQEPPKRQQVNRLEKDEVVTPWPPTSGTQSSPPAVAPGTLPVQAADEHEQEQEVAPAITSRPRHLSLGGISNILARRPVEPPTHSSTLPLPTVAGVPTQRRSFYGRFAPFDVDQESSQLSPGAALVSPISPGVSMSLIPSGIMDTPAGSENEDGFVLTPERDSPISIEGEQDGQRESSNFPAPDPTTIPELRFEHESYSPDQASPELSYQQRFERFDSQRAFIKPAASSESFFDPSDFSSESFPLTSEDRADSVSVKSRKWFSKDKGEEENRDREVSMHKGLNPDAKIFKFTRKTPFLSLSNPNANGIADHNGRLLDTAPLIDPLNPSGPPPMPPPPTPRTSFFSSLRAFQPSPAEREALRLAMVSSANNSLERLNSSGSHHSGNSYSPPATNAGSPLLHGPFIGSPGTARSSLPGQGHNSTVGAFAARNPWMTSSNHTSSHSLDALATATVKAVNGSSEEFTNGVGESTFTSAPPHKKSFSFNPWGGDRLLGGK